MKVFKKLSMLFVAAAMMMTTVTTAFAQDGDNTPSITMKKDGSTFTAYRVLDGEKKNASGTYVFTPNADFENFFAGNGFGNFTFDSDKGIMQGNNVITETNGIKTDGKSQRNAVIEKTKATELATQLQAYKNKNESITGIKLASDELKTVDAGYYLIVENEGAKQVGDKLVLPSRSMLVKVTDGVVISPKDSDLTIDKKVKGDDGLFTDKNTMAVGDTVNYKIETALPKFDDSERNPVFELKDTLTGLKYAEPLNLVIKSNSDETVVYEQNVDFTVTKTENTMTIVFNFESNKVRDHANSGDGIIITYDAIVTDDAIKEHGNEVELKFGNSNETIKDSTTTYTYDFDIIKYGVDGSTMNKKVLEGAEFKLEDNNGHVYEGMSNKDGLIQFKGLKAGTYTLTETKAPSGYALLEGSFTVTIEDEDLDGIATLTVSDSKYASVENGKMVLNIDNYQGISLPETGGMGTTIFMIGGASLIALAGVMLVIYSKKAKKA